LAIGGIGRPKQKPQRELRLSTAPTGKVIFPDAH